MQQCKLVHGDLSEYNMYGPADRSAAAFKISKDGHLERRNPLASRQKQSLRLYHDEQLYIIDVSQSVESDHPQALDFLKRDCVNVSDPESSDAPIDKLRDA